MYYVELLTNLLPSWYIKFEMFWNQNSSIKKCVGGVTKKIHRWERHLKELKELIIVTVVYLKQKH